MLRQVSLAELGNVDFVPQAILSHPITFFSQRLGFKFDADVDDLDEYQSAFFRLENNFPFALIHYRGNPGNTTTIYFERGIKREDVVQIVRQIAANLDLPPTDVVWISTS